MTPRNPAKNNKNRRYPETIKTRAREMVFEFGMTRAETARELGVPWSTIDRWAALAPTDTGQHDDTGTSGTLEEIARIYVRRI